MVNWGDCKSELLFFSFCSPGSSRAVWIHDPQYRKNKLVSKLVGRSEEFFKTLDHYVTVFESRRNVNIRCSLLPM